MTLEESWRLRVLATPKPHASGPSIPCATQHTLGLWAAMPRKPPVQSRLQLYEGIHATGIATKYNLMDNGVEIPHAYQLGCYLNSKGTSNLCIHHEH